MFLERYALSLSPFWIHSYDLKWYIAASDMEISETVGRILEMCTVNTASIIQGLTTGTICFVCDYQNLSCNVKILSLCLFFLNCQLQERRERVFDH